MENIFNYSFVITSLSNIRYVELCYRCYETKSYDSVVLQDIFILVIMHTPLL
jgi:hypothetical protein